MSIVALFAFVVLVTVEMRKRHVLFESFVTSGTDSDGKLATIMLIDYANGIHKISEPSYTVRNMEPRWARPDLRLKDGASLISIATFFHDLLDMKRHMIVAGELTHIGVPRGDVKLILRINRKYIAEFHGSIVETPRLLEMAALRVLLETEQYIFIKYHFMLARDCSHVTTDDFNRLANRIVESPEFDYRTKSMSLVLLGNLLVYGGDHEAAIEEYKMATELWTRNAWAYVAWGKALSDFENGVRDEGDRLSLLARRHEAFRKYRRATRLDPSYASAYVQWGMTLLDVGKYRRAIRKFRLATRVDGGDSWAYVSWSSALMKANKLDRALNKAESNYSGVA